MSINLRRVDLNLLTIFDSLMETHNLSHTAEALGIAQPSVSQALKRLQGMYDDPLFVRSNREMKPTLKANKIYPVVADMLENIRQTLPIKGQFVRKDLEMELKINIPYLDHYPYIFDLLECVSKEAPKVNIFLTNNVIKDVEIALRNKEYDLHIDVFESSNTACFSKIIYTDQPVIISVKNTLG